VTSVDLTALIPLALGIAHRLAAARGMAHYADELGSVAMLALGRALAGYDEGEGPVEPYAAAWVAAEVRKAIAREKNRREVLLDEVEPPSSLHPAALAEEVARDVVDAFLSASVGECLRAGGETAYLRREAWAVLRAEVERLDDPSRRLLHLRYWSEDEPTWREVGAALGIAERTAKLHDAQIRDRLRDALVAWDRVRPLRRA
jgi:RNA polymerase sigma factor (sigma-70 family)